MGLSNILIKTEAGKSIYYEFEFVLQSVTLWK